jgi:VIT1/CCC1 family predicted Fe2+/Mn2+ transporter
LPSQPSPKQGSTTETGTHVSSERQPLAERHGHHRDVTGGWLRPAVFGVMDGLVSNFALVAGVTGGGVSDETVVLAGLAGLVAGAMSMATGEYTSVASQSELTLAEIDVEKQEIHRRPGSEQAELARLYQARGLNPQLADEVARELSQRPDVWKIHVCEEMGVDPDDLPSPWTAAGSSFLAFAVGATVPVLPYLLGVGSLLVALVATAIALFGAGALVGRLTARSPLYTGTRQLLLGLLAGAATFLIGSLVGTGMS